MASVTRVAKAAKAQGNCSKCGAAIDKGQPYLWWKFRYGSKIVRCMADDCRPKPQELTQSEWTSRVLDFEEQRDEIVSRHRDTATAENLPDIQELASDLTSLGEDVREFGEEQTEKRDNMPENLQDSETGTLLEERAGYCEEAADELDRLASEAEGLDLVDVTDVAAMKDWAAQESIDRKDYGSDEEYLDAVKAAAVAHNNDEVGAVLDEVEGVGFEG